jgi:very-short-patch-repair endonuclease
MRRMKRIPPPGSTDRARRSRKNPTEAKKALWRLLREAFPEQGFRRQVPIRQYFADFASHRAKLVIEADGGHHDVASDARRTAVIEEDGYRVLRFWNNDILGNPDGVARTIEQNLRRDHPHPPTR